MAFITLRNNATSSNTTTTSVKTTPLTNAEIDNNFINLNNDIGLKPTIGIQWVSGATMVLGQYIYYSANPTSNLPTYNYYQVTTAGTMPTTAPTHTTGVVSGLTYAGNNTTARIVYSPYDMLNSIKSLTGGSGGGLNADTLTFNSGARTATNANTANSIVARDGSGNFSAGTITATLTGNVTGNLYANDATLVFNAATKAFVGDVTGTVKNSTGGTAVYTNDTSTVTNAMLAGSIANGKLTNSSISINSNTVSLGGSIDIKTISGAWTSSQTFSDNLITITDNVDPTKTLVFQLSTLSAAAAPANANRILNIPAADGTIATVEYVQTAGQNSQGAKTVQVITTGVPSNSAGNNGDIIYQY